MSNPSQDALEQAPLREDEIDLFELFGILWDGKGLIILITGLAAALSVFVALSLPNIYESRALLAPKAEKGLDGMAGLAGQYGGLASLAGINLSQGNGISKSELAKEKVKSLAFFQEHLYETFLPELMATKSWNAVRNEVVFDETIYDPSTQKWVRNVMPPKNKKPSAQEAHEVFLALLSVDDTPNLGLIEISIKHESPQTAQAWAALLVERVSEDLRDRDVAEARESIKFLEAQIEQSRLVAVDEVLAQLIEEQTKTIMLANVSKSYVFDVIDPPVVPELKAEPARALICILGTLLGGFLGVMFVLARHYRAMRSSAASG